MAITKLQSLFQKIRKRRLASHQLNIRRPALNLGLLETRAVPAITAVYTPAAEILSVFGDANDNIILITRNVAGAIQVIDNGSPNSGETLSLAVPIIGGTPTVANTELIQVFGQAGNDTIALDETNGELPRANLFGGAGDDTLIGGSGNDQLFGQAGNDTLLGKGGEDILFGGAGGDLLMGGTGNDQVFGEAGNDRIIWNPGDGSDLNEGGAGVDTVEVNGGNAAEQFTASPNGTHVRFDRVSPAPFFLDIGTSENLVVNMNGGDDTFTGSNGLANLIKLTVDGGAGNDTITGGDGNDHLIGGDGNDLITGGRGNDVVLLGAGDDTFAWNPGDGNDTVEGQAGADALVFTGANVSEQFALSANGARVRFTRDVGNVVVDVNGVERVDVNGLGGADLVTVNDLAGTDVTQVNATLHAGAGGGDLQHDTVTVNGTPGNDIIDVFGEGTAASVVGLSAKVNVFGSDGTVDSLIVNALGGDDGVTASTLPANVFRVTVDGGAGNDVILGSRADDTLIGGDGADFILGNAGNDAVQLGAGDDTFQWNPGDGSDSVEGQGGRDLMLFFGSNVGENVDISANNGHVHFTRDIGNIAMDLNGVENIEFRALGGADNIVVNDLTGTDAARIDLDLRGPDGGGDGADDSITLNATQGDDTFGAAGDSGGVSVFGLQAKINVFSQDATDHLTLNGFGGKDRIAANSLPAGAIQLTINGGDGDDVITGSDGNDTIIGGRGNDVALLGAGDDTFVWNPGDGNDTVEGQGGQDTLLFNGANVDENIVLSANGGRLLLTRNVGNILMNVNGVEQVNVNVFGGADKITVNDLTGTDVADVRLNLAAAGGADDGAPDNVIVQGTNSADVITVSGDANGVAVVGLAAKVSIIGHEAANDRLTINALAGDDVVDASGMTTSGMLFTADGGVGDDVLIGGNGNDMLFGGVGDDVLIGGPGNDILDGGAGNNILIQ
jgi:Ca2+-binding RTX toxin-like protein